MNQILIDSSFLVALHNSRDVNHRRAARFAQNDSSLSLIPDVVLPEVAFVLRSEGGIPAVSLLLRTLIASEVMLEPTLLSDLKRAERDHEYLL